MISILRELYLVVRPSGLRRLATPLSLILIQAVMQTLAVFSLMPFLSAVADVAAFRHSSMGRRFADLVGDPSDRQLLVIAGSIALGTLIIGNVITIFAEAARSKYVYYFSHSVRNKIVHIILNKKYDYFFNVNKSFLLKNAIEDVEITGSQLLLPALELCTRTLICLFLVSLISVIEPVISAISGVAIVVYYLIIVQPIRHRASQTSDTSKVLIRDLYFEVHQTLEGIKPIFAAERRRFFEDRASAASLRFSKAMSRISLYAVVPRSGLEILVFGGLIVWVLAAIISGGSLNSLIPRIGLIAVVAYRLMPSLQYIFAQIGAMNSSKRALDEVLGILQSEGKATFNLACDTGCAEIAPMSWGQSIRFEAVSFAYRGTEERAIHDLDLTIEKGQRIALVGPTGSGKSSFIDLLLGLLEPTHGQILVDGIPLTAANLPAWRRATGYVPQEIFLLDGSIKENIAFGHTDDDQDAARVAEAIELAQAGDFVAGENTRGLDAPVGERGVKLSGGQRQRLALARAFYEKPSLLILDEATSALDPRTEQRVMEALRRERAGMTIVTVTHRISTVADYDCIYYIENGRILYSGNYASLVENHENFRKFVSK